MRRSIQGSAGRAVALAALGLASVLPAAPLLQAQEGATHLVLSSPYQPSYNVVPPSTGSSDVEVSGVRIAAVQGTVLHGEGDLLLLGYEDHVHVVRIPMGARASGSQEPALMAEAIPVGSRAEAVGLPATSGILETLRLELWWPEAAD